MDSRADEQAMHMKRAAYAYSVVTVASAQLDAPLTGPAFEQAVDDFGAWLRVREESALDQARHIVARRML
jgi:hypothetical protein